MPGFVRLASAAAFAGLFSHALILLITPASNNEIKRFYASSLGLLGWLPVALMLGFFIAILSIGSVTDRRGKLPAITAGCCAMGAGALLFSQSSSFGLSVAATFVMGIGGGLSEGSAMALVSDLYHDRIRTMMMNLSQAAFGLGAVASPLAIGWLLSAGMSWRLGYVATGAVCLASSVLAFSAWSLRQEKPVADPGLKHDVHGLLSDRLVLCLAVGILLYVAGEMGQSNWLSIYMRRALNASRALAAASPSLMWLGVLLGRLAAAWAAKRMSETAIIIWSLGLAAASQALLLVVKAPLPGLAAALGLGFFLGPVFPTILSLAGSAYRDRSGGVMSVIVAAGAVGGAVFPLAIGGLGDLVGIRGALWVCCGVLVADALMFARLRARS